MKLGMKLYEKLEVTVGYQNFGSAWLIILRGKEEDIELAYNSLYNLCATPNRCTLEFPEQTKTVATFWTDEQNLLRYWRNRYECLHPELGRTIAKRKCAEAENYALTQVNILRDTCHEFFRDFSKNVPEYFGTGTISAAKPDSDFKDAVLTHAFEDKNTNKTIDKE